MAYRKTEKVLAQLEAKRASMIAAAIDVIARSGLDGLGCDAVAGRAGVAVGLIFKYFPDMAELRAAAVQRVLERDLAAIRERAAEERDGVHALVGAIAVFYSRYTNSPVTREIRHEPIYDSAIREEFERMIHAAVDIDKIEGKLAGAAAVATITAMAKARGRDAQRASLAVLFILRGIGVSNAVARKIVTVRWGTEAAEAFA